MPVRASFRKPNWIDPHTVVISCPLEHAPGNWQAAARLSQYVSACLDPLAHQDRCPRLVFHLHASAWNSSAVATMGGAQPLTTDGDDNWESGAPSLIANLHATALRIMSWPNTTAAIVDGRCRATPAELAAWCDFRIATTATDTALEYVHARWGMPPLMGAAVRLPRLLGGGGGTYVLASGQPIIASRAQLTGLVDRLIDDSDQLIEQAATALDALEQANEICQLRRRRDAPLTRRGSNLVTDDDLAQLLLTMDHPAPDAVHRIVAAMRATAALSGTDALARCQEIFAHWERPAMGAALVRVDQLVRYSSITTPAVHSGTTPEPLGRIGICGAGVMGRGIAAASVAAGLTAGLYDASDAAIDSARTAIHADLDADDATPWPRWLSVPDARARLSIFASDTDFQDCSIVVESVVEQLDLKKRVLQRIESSTMPGTLLASNTSTIPITELGKALTRSEQLCGIHFCNPVRRRQLVEIVRGEQTNDQAIALAVRYVRRLGKMPIVVRDTPGFVVNRLLVAYLNEALVMLCEGLPITVIDSAARAFGMPLGPFQLFDLIGMETAMMAGRSLWDAFPDRVTLNPVLPALVKRDRLGWSTRVGFYRYPSLPGPATTDPQLDTLLTPYIRRETDAFPSPQGLMDRLLLPMVLEATRILDEGVVSTSDDIDRAAVFGLAFPAASGGISYWANRRGPKELLELCNQYASRGEKFAPTARLRQATPTGTLFDFVPPVGDNV